MVFIMRADGMTGSTGYTYQFLAFPVEESEQPDYCLLTQTGFRLNSPGDKSRINAKDIKYVYIALK